MCASAITMVDPFSQQDGKISTLLHFVVTTTADTYENIYNKHAHTVHLAAQYHYRSFFPIRTTHIFKSHTHTLQKERENERTNKKLHTQMSRVACILTFIVDVELKKHVSGGRSFADQRRRKSVCWWSQFLLYQIKTRALSEKKANNRMLNSHTQLLCVCVAVSAAAWVLALTVCTRESMCVSWIQTAFIFRNELYCECTHCTRTNTRTRTHTYMDVPLITFIQIDLIPWHRFGSTSISARLTRECYSLLLLLSLRVDGKLVSTHSRFIWILWFSCMYDSLDIDWAVIGLIAQSVLSKR